MRAQGTLEATPNQGQDSPERPRLPTRTIIRIMIAHDFYHAGEINHLRALLHGTDRCEYE